MHPEPAAALTEHALFVERKRSDGFHRDTACRAICTIKRGLRVAAARRDGAVAFIPENWDSVFRPSLGAYLKFLLSRPDQFRVLEGARPGQYSIENVTMNKTVVALTFGKGKVKGKAKGAGKHQGKRTITRGFGGKSYSNDASLEGKASGKGKTVGKLFSRSHSKGKVVKGSSRIHMWSDQVDEAGVDRAEETAQDVEAPANDEVAAAEEESMPVGASWDEQVEESLRQQGQDNDVAQSMEIVGEGVASLEEVEGEFDLVEEVAHATVATSDETPAQEQSCSVESMFDWTEDA